MEKLDYDFAISSSSNDPFQDYQGQDAIILDDVRDTVFEFQDLLKMLDNNTASSFKSRFANKVFNGKMIVLTSSVPLHYWYRSASSNMPSWYKQVRTSGKEDFTQLCRRISCYVQVTDDTVTVYNELDNDGKPIGRASVYVNEVKNLKKQKRTSSISIQYLQVFAKNKNMNLKKLKTTVIYRFNNGVGNGLL